MTSPHPPRADAASREREQVVDDTFVYLRKGFPLSLLPFTGTRLPPPLAEALEPRAGAADAFREWAIGLGVDWADPREIASPRAHNAVSSSTRNNCAA